MKALVNEFRGQPIHGKAVILAELAAFIFLFVMFTGEAKAQSGNIFAPQQAQVSGDVWQGQVMQVSRKEVEPSYQARAAGAAVGGALGFALASRSNSQNRAAVNTVGAVLGGLLGERATSVAATNEAQEIILKVQAPGQQERVMVIVQPAPFDAVSPGDQVFVTVVNGTYRVIRRAGLM